MRKTISVLLACAALCGCCGCAGGNAGSAGSSVGGAEEILLASFESYEELFRVDFSNMIADIDLSEDFVTDGGKSVRLDIRNATDDGWPDGSCYLPYAPNFALLKKNLTAEFDIKKAQSISLDVRNENARGIYLCCSMYNDMEARLYTDLQYIPASADTTAVFPLPQRFMNEDWTDLAKITFSVYDELLPAEACVIGFDNVRLKMAESVSPVTKIFARNELMSFSSATDIQYLKNYCTTNFPAAYIRHAAALPGGGGGLNLRFIGTDGGNGRPNTEYYNDTQNMGVMISPDVVSMFDFTKLGRLSVELFNGDKVAHKAHLGASGGGKSAETAALLSPGEWTTLTLDDFKSVDKSAVDCVYFYLDTWRVTEAFDVYAKNLRYGR